MNPEQPTQTPVQDIPTPTPTPPAPALTPPPVTQVPQKLPISKLGLWSLLIPVVVVPGLLILGLLLGIVLGVLIFDGDDTTKALSGFLSPLYGLFIAAYVSDAALLAAVAFGIASLFVKNKRKTFGIIGLPLAAIGLIITLAIPALMRALLFS